MAARALIDEGAIGEVRQLQADLGVDRPYNPADRLFDLAQGGGAMLDLGVYVVSFAQHFPRHARSGEGAARWLLLVSMPRRVCCSAMTTAESPRY